MVSGTAIPKNLLKNDSKKSVEKADHSGNANG
jgi:hypothetical protein